MKKVTVLLLVSFLGICVQAEKVNGLEFPKQLKVEQIDLSFHGGGTRKKYFVSIYTSALYLKKKNNDGKKVTEANEAMAVRMCFAYRTLTKSQVVGVWNDCFENVTNGNVKPIKKEIDQFLKYFAGEGITEGDIFKLIYVPETGVAVYKNDKLVGTVKGLPFKQALFSVWFGDKPIQENLKTGMLKGK